MEKRGNVEPEDYLPNKEHVYLLGLIIDVMDSYMKVVDFVPLLGNEKGHDKKQNNCVADNQKIVP
jgi:hypothetical protein